jgi:hypothetical protein
MRRLTQQAESSNCGYADLTRRTSSGGIIDEKQNFFGLASGK